MRQILCALTEFQDQHCMMQEMTAGCQPQQKEFGGNCNHRKLRPTCPSPRSLTTLSEKDELQGIASVISDAIGVGAKKKIAKQRINMLEGNVASYSRVLNSASQMKRIKEMNEVMSIVGEICGENDWAKEERSIANKVETQGKERKKVAAVASLEQKNLKFCLI